MPRERGETEHRRRLRRATRDDVGLLAGIAGGPEPGRVRATRRILGSLASDVYVAVDGDGPPVGVVMVAYRRSLAHGGLVAEIDLLRCLAPLSPEGRREVEALLLDGALHRARRRGARAVSAAADGEGRDDLLARAGFDSVAGRRVLPLVVGDP